MIRALLVDDQALVRAGFRAILDQQEDIEVVGEAENGAEAVTMARQHRPDVVLMDIRMPGVDGIQATRDLVRLEAPPRVLILTTYDLDEYLYEAMKAGASGFVLKDVRAEQLAPAVRAVAQGDSLVGSAPTKRLIEAFLSRRGRDRQTLARLTEREVQVLELIGQGLSNREIADELSLSEATIKSHVNRIFAKAHLRDRVHAVVLAYETGLVEPGS